MEELLVNWSGLGFLVGIAGFVVGVLYGSSHQVGKMFLCISIGIAGIGWLVFGFITMNQAQADACRAQGGYPIIGDKGHYKTCVASEHIIKVESK